MEKLRVTNVKIYPFDTSSVGGHIRAVAEITINDILVIKGIKLIQNKYGGFFIDFPKKATSYGKLVDIVEILDNSFVEIIRRKIVDEYKKLFL